MNFLYIGNFPNDGVRSGEESITLALERAGHKVYPFHFRQRGADAKLKEFNKTLPPVDFVLLSKATKHVLEQTIRKMVKGRKSISWIFDGLGQWRVIQQWALISDLFIVVAEGEIPLYHKFGLKNVISIQVGCDPEIDFYPFQKEKEHDIVFLGGDDMGRRKKILQKIDKAFPNQLSVFGPAKTMSSLGKVYKGPAYGEAGRKVIANSKIVLGMQHYTRDSFKGLWSNRIYKTLAAGTFFLQEYIKGMDEVFQDKKHIVLWKSDEQLMRKIKHYLRNESERVQIAKQGQKFVLKKHTYDNRVKDFLDFISYEKLILNVHEKKYKQATLFWGSERGRDLRLETLINIVPLKNQTILDVGCGFGDLYFHLKDKDIKEYMGIDINQRCIQKAKQRFPKVEFLKTNVLGFGKQFDYVFGSGLFWIRFDNWFEVTLRILKKMYSLAKKGVAVNFIIEHQKLIDDGVSYSSTESEIREMVKKVTTNFKIVSGYKDNDLTVYLFKK